SPKLPDLPPASFVLPILAVMSTRSADWPCLLAKQGGLGDPPRLPRGLPSPVVAGAAGCRNRAATAKSDDPGSPVSSRHSAETQSARSFSTDLAWQIPAGSCITLACLRG